MACKTLRDHLNQLGDKVGRQVPYLNSGGCCVFASAVADELRKVTKTTRIVVSDDRGDNDMPIPAMRKHMRDNHYDRYNPFDWNNAGLHFAHVFIEFKDERGYACHYDSNGVTERGHKDPTFGYKVVDGYLTNKEAREMSASGNGWNRCFDHRRYAKVVRRIVRDYFEKHIHPTFCPN